MPITDTAGLDQMNISIQADWACVWIRVEGAIDSQSIPLVMPVVREACGRGPRKLILLLQGSIYLDENLDVLIAQVVELTRSYGVKLVIQEARARRSSGPHHQARWSFPRRRTRWVCTA